MRKVTAVHDAFHPFSRLRFAEEDRTEQSHFDFAHITKLHNDTLSRKHSNYEFIVYLRLTRRLTTKDCIQSREFNEQ